MKSLLRFLYRMRYGVRGAIKPPLGFHAWAPPSWPRRALYRFRHACWQLESRAYEWTGLPAQWRSDVEVGLNHTIMLSQIAAEVADQCDPGTTTLEGVRRALRDLATAQDKIADIERDGNAMQEDADHLAKLLRRILARYDDHGGFDGTDSAHGRIAVLNARDYLANRKFIST